MIRDFYTTCEKLLLKSNQFHIFLHKPQYLIKRLVAKTY